MKILDQIRIWWPTLLVLAVVIYATLFPDPYAAEELPPIPCLDKLIHAIMFGGLAAAIAFDYQRARRRHNVLTPRAMIVICLLSVLTGGVIEIAQEAMHIGRSGDWMDFLADTTGVMVAYFAAPTAIRKVLKVGKGSN